MSGPVGDRLEAGFFARDPRTVAAELIGCALFRDGVGGRIVETEAYAEYDPACHAHVGRTDRSEVLFGPPGRAYVYLSYGIHQLFNVVTEPDGTAAAVLIRALEPLCGLERMRARRGPRRPDRELCAGPGRLTQALGIGAATNQADLATGVVGLYGRAASEAPDLEVGPRIGITKAADWPWRWWERDSPWVSR